MKIKFQKYQGTGNDFIVLDNRDNQFDELALDQIHFLCNRRFGVGADGLIWVKNHPELDFEMRYYNADGSRSFCGNGARCAVKFAQSLGLFETECRFLAIDGVHSAFVSDGLIHLQMSDVDTIDSFEQDWIVNTGSPHYVRFCPDLANYDIIEFGKSVRYSPPFREKGINVNLVVRAQHGLELVTYERGVEDETLSCGTGATAAAIAMIYDSKHSGKFLVPIHVKGGDLFVSGIYANGRFSQLFLIGPAEKVFYGELSL